MIKKFALICVFFINIFIVNIVISNEIPAIILQDRLNKINNLYVHFIQKINDINNNILEEYQGELWIKRPNLFYWHMMYPEENFLICDGRTLWFYIPVIKQVTVYCAKNIFDNIFWMLFVNDDTSLWCNYNVFQQGDYFFLKPIYNSTNMKECKIKITDYGIIEQFSIIEPNGEYIDYYLSKHNNNEINISKFAFEIPDGIQLDDQRT